MKLNLEDVHYHNINEFSDDFDVKDVHDDFNICERCNTIVMWDTEMYWQGECEESYHYCMKDYEAVCDDCFYQLSNQKIRNWFYKLKCNLLDFFYKIKQIRSGGYYL